LPRHAFECQRTAPFPQFLLVDREYHLPVLVVRQCQG
jgi:hypothetical protein